MYKLSHLGKFLTHVKISRSIFKARSHVPLEVMQANKSLAAAIIADMMQNPTAVANRSKRKDLHK